MLETERLMAEARERLTSHPMCAKLIESPGKILVMFPPGFRADGAQMRYAEEAVSKTRAFDLLVTTCEKYWQLG